MACICFKVLLEFYITTLAEIWISLVKPIVNGNLIGKKNMNSHELQPYVNISLIPWWLPAMSSLSRQLNLGERMIIYMLE